MKSNSVLPSASPNEKPLSPKVKKSCVLLDSICITYTFCSYTLHCVFIASLYTSVQEKMQQEISEVINKVSQSRITMEAPTESKVYTHNIWHNTGN